jgi:hypothetical protein
MADSFRQRLHLHDHDLRAVQTGLSNAVVAEKKLLIAWQAIENRHIPQDKLVRLLNDRQFIHQAISLEKIAARSRALRFAHRQKAKPLKVTQVLAETTTRKPI